MQKPRRKTKTTLNHIAGLVCAQFGVSHEALKSPQRDRAICVPRHIFVMLARDYTDASYPAIAKYLNRDHTTLIHSEREARRKWAAVLYLDVAAIRGIIEGRRGSSAERIVNRLKRLGAES